MAALLLTAGSVHAFSCEASSRLPLLQKCRRSAALSLKIPEAPISDFMTPIADAVVLDPEMNLRVAATLMQEKQITGAPVVSNKKLVGVLSQFDFLFKAAGLNALDLEAESYQTTVKKILGGTVRNAMTLDPVTFSPRDSVSAAAAVMIKRRFNHVPVVDPDNGSVVGIIRSTDVMRYVLTKS